MAITISQSTHALCDNIVLFVPQKGQKGKLKKGTWLDSRMYRFSIIFADVLSLHPLSIHCLHPTLLYLLYRVCM